MIQKCFYKQNCYLLILINKKGQIIHITRKGSSFSTSIMKSNYADSQLFVNNVAFHHELQDLLLAGYGNGEIRLYHINYSNFKPFLFVKVSLKVKIQLILKLFRLKLGVWAAWEIRSKK